MQQLGGIRSYRCPRVVLSHACKIDLERKRSIPFALGAHDLASLPTVVKKLADGINASPKDIRDAITLDLPVAASELDHLQGSGKIRRSSSVLSHALQIAREVQLLSGPFASLTFFF